MDIADSSRSARSREAGTDRPAELLSFFERAPVGLVLISADDFTVLGHNPAALAPVSAEFQQRGTFTGMRTDEMLDPAAAEGLGAILRHAITTGEAVAVPEFPGKVWPDPQVRYYRGSATPLFDSAGQVYAVLTCTIEITEQIQAREEIARLAEAAQARSEELEIVIENMADAVMITDVEGRVILTNRAYRESLGVPAPGEMSVDRIAHFRPRDERGRPITPEQGPAARALRGERYAGAEYLVSDAGGKERHLAMSGAPLRRRDGTVSGSVVVVRDITPLRAAEKDKDAFLSLVAHELRTPVTVIRGFAQLMDRRLQDADPTIRRALNAIDRQVSQLAGLIDDLLDLSRLQEGTLAQRRTAMDYGALIHEVVDEMQLLYPEHRLWVHCPPSLSVLGDAVRLRQVLVNLIENAIKYGPRLGAVRVTVEVESGAVTTYVCDEGPPLSDDEKERVFERFYHRASGSGGTPGGLGVGLFIGRAIVEAHGGRIWTGHEDHSCFAFSLPQGTEE